MLKHNDNFSCADWQPYNPHNCLRCLFMNPLGIVTQRNDYRIFANCIRLLWNNRKRYPVNTKLYSSIYISLLMELENEIKRHVTVIERDAFSRALEVKDFNQARSKLDEVAQTLGEYDSETNGLKVELRFKEMLAGLGAHPTK